MVIVAITYLDHFMEWTEGDSERPKELTVYGVEHVSPHPGFVAVISETSNDGEHHAVTHIFEAAIVGRRELS